MRQNAKRGAVLECKHVRYYRNGAPSTGDRVWCPECGDMRRVLSWEGWYWARCYGCNHSFTRSNLDTLGRNAKRHRCHKPSFRYWVWRTGWKEIPESLVFALDSDPLWADTDTTQAATRVAATESEAGL